MFNVLMHNCEFCGDSFEYDYSSAYSYDNDLINCPNCGAAYYVIFNFLNDFIYLEPCREHEMDLL